MKKLLICLVVIALFATSVIPANAAGVNSGSVSLRYVNIVKATVSLNVTSGGNATVTLTAKGASNVTSIKATTYLEQKVGSSWMRVNLGTSSNSWTHTVNSNTLSKTYTKQLSANEEYRAIVTYTMVSSTTTEHVTKIDYS